ncbi:M-phase phosphoprotein 9 isoform X1 [Syngnathus scovelli]|uniref:M-phase phosphoprotein 9 isoform X1 n=1 Tax=Syngnathus scovelli TaxID=161590 RepID=UPI00211080F5|nr:M-phase phosphoprotein 9 isoform X1 [Syngnathus scovelli]XP_049594756.1 M-phase phosphoprotein 9 isoform X1 [Syngnathus scovelli]
MSTDDSISEDVSSSGPRSHCRASGDGGGKESEASPLSSEATTASGLAVSEGRPSASQTTGGSAACQTVKYTPPCSKIRGLCISTEDDAFTSGKNLPFINPSSLDTLRALVEEIRSGGETDPQVWKDCEGRWLHLFQLVEKQYQEQILAQQEQYQCQIQLIQDEIKALVQLQNRPPHADFTHGAGIQTSEDTTITTTKDFLLPLMAGDCIFPARAPSESDSLAAPAALSPFSSPSPPHRSDGANPPVDEQATTGLSSGYGTLSAWETGEAAERQEHRWSEDADAPDEEEPPAAHQQKSSGQILTSWALRQKLRAKKIKTRLNSRIPEYEELPRSPAKLALGPSESPNSRHPATASSCASFALRRSDSLSSEASGLTYWRLNECDLYRRLPDALDRNGSGAAFFLQENSTDQAEDLGVSLRELYQHKHRTDLKRSDWERSETSTPLSLQPLAAEASQPFSTTPLSLDGVSDESQEVPPTPRMKTGEEADVTRSRSTTLRPGSSSLEDPVVFSLLRRNLREKHARHVTDLKAYYECEIQVLRDKLKLRDLPGDLEKSNRMLSERCQHLEKALAEASRRIDKLEQTNSTLEKQLAEWPERYAVAGATVKSLRQRLEDSKRSAKEKAAAVKKARRQVDDSEAKREREVQANKELLAQYNSVLKDNDKLKSNLLSTEDKLYQANNLTSDLKRTISKLESQVRQLEHENQTRVRHTPQSAAQPSGAGLFHHPDLLHSPSRGNAEPDVTRRRSPRLEVQQPAAATTSAFPSQTSRCTAPRDPDQTPSTSRLREEGAAHLSPIMRALIEMEETRATESRAPWVANHRPSLGGVGGALRSQRSLSPDGHRSSSLPPAGLKSTIATTPTKRETLLAPLPAKGSPKRCPTENYSTAFGHMMPREEHLGNRRDSHVNHTRRHSFHNGSPRTRLRFGSPEHHNAAVGLASPDYGEAQLPCEDGGGSPGGYLASDNKVLSLAEAERLFDELTREKLEIEASLSRIPTSGGRVNMKTRLDQVALEERLEHLNRDLGSIRMTLKRFHILRSSGSIA